MPKLIRQLVQALFPVVAIPVATCSTQLEAHALATLLLAEGGCAVIYPASIGFCVAKVGRAA